MMTTIPFHPLADLFPLIEGAEFDELAANIKGGRLREPIVIIDGAILDGRDRYRACVAAGVEPVCVQFSDIAPDADPIAFVSSRNLRRRHLYDSQRAMVAAKIARFEVGDNQHTRGSENLPTQSSAATMFNVSDRSVRSAKAVQEKGTASLVHAVEQGNLSVSAAAKATRLGPAKQDEVAALASQGNSKAARKAIADETDQGEPIVEGKAARKVIPDAPRIAVPAT